MSQMPTPPLSRGVSAEPPSSSNDECESITIDDKVQLLDELLERYLYLLDRHQKLQESLGKQLSSGFFQLTHANYVSPGRRFGEDFYDDRMKATRRLQITSSSRDKEPKYRNIDTRLKNVHFEVNYKSVLDTKEEEKAKDKGKESDSAHDDAKDRDEQNPDISAAPPTPPQTTQDSSANKEVDATNDNSDKKKPVRKIFRSDDPISWYGILVPPSLRGAQKSFIKAINDDIPQLVTVVKEMQDVENLVYELRRQMQMTT